MIAPRTTTPAIRSTPASSFVSAVIRGPPGDSTLMKLTLAERSDLSWTDSSAFAQRERWHCCVSRSRDLVAGNSSAEPRSRSSRSRRSEVRPPVSRVQPQPPRDETVRVPASRSSDRITQQCPSTVPQADRLPGAGSRLLLTGNSANPHSDPGVTQHEPGLVVSELAGEVEGRSAVVVLLRCATGPDV